MTKRVSTKPIRLYHGSADDWMPVGPCRDYVARLRKAGAIVNLVEYPGANHVFDNQANRGHGTDPAGADQPQMPLRGKTARRDH
jgi:dienelactone hydrolase